MTLIKYDVGNDSCEEFAVNTEGIRILEILDSSRILFVTSMGAFHTFDISTNSSRPLRINGQNVRLVPTVLDLHVDNEGLVWIATVSGLYKLDIPNKEFQNLNNKIPGFDFRFLCIEEDDSGNLWLGTSLSGLIIMNTKNLEFTQRTSSNGLCNNTVVTITKDANDSFWIGTFNGIALVSKNGKLISNFYEEDGIIHNECNRHSATLLSDGRIAIGSISGFTILDPSKIHSDFLEESEVEVYLTKASYFDPQVNRTIEKTKALSTFDKVILPAFNKNLLLRFATSNYIKPLENKYAYRLDRGNWIDIGTENELDFKELPSGKYNLQIRGSDHQGNWSNNIIELDIIAKTIFYQNPWFYLLLGIGLVGLALFWIYSLRGQVDRATKQIKFDKEVIERQAAKLKELDEVKSRFFTNISHEFRTPLTIIKGMVEQIKEKPEVHLKSGTKMIKRNTDDLLNLVNQIMDLRKLESNELKLNMIQSDIIHYLRLISESYTSLAAQKGITLRFHTEQEELIMDFDAEKLLRIVSNLMSNAIKFTNSGGEIHLRLDQQKGQELLLQVEDTGVGMRPENLSSIFDRFYQEKAVEESEKGTGIGLALTKALVDLLQGKIEVKSELGKGSVFNVYLPISRTAILQGADNILIPQNKEIVVGPDKHTHIPTLQPVHEHKPRLLIVEDNLDLQQYFAAALEDYYQIDLANNGAIGIQKAIEQIPDLIISDVMMPEKDGFELTQTLKNDEHTDHIPIILLTAKGDIESKISGLSRGADAYLAKPFEKRELLVRIDKLLELRKKLQERYTKRNLESDTPIIIEDPFLQKMHEYIVEHISDADLNMDQLTKAMAMSRTQVFRKLKALTGQSATLFIRSIRLKKSKELLRTTDLNISEVAYEVGFTSLSYFSTAFFEEFGVRPTTYRK